MAAPRLTAVAHINTNAQRPRPLGYGTYALGQVLQIVHRTSDLMDVFFNAGWCVGPTRLSGC